MATIQYLAGLFDGEGCISLVRASPRNKSPKARTPAYALHLHIRMTSKQTVDTFADYFRNKFGEGGYTARQESECTRHRPTYCFSCSHNKAERIIKELLPYLITKKAEAEEAIRFQDYMRESCCRYLVGVARKPVPEHILAKRHQFYLNLKILKRRQQ